MEKLTERFLRYTRVNTQSDETSLSCPSTGGQKVLAEMLADELRTIGLAEVNIDQHGYLTATIPSNISGNVPVIGFLAHLDTSPDFTAVNVNPRVVDYKGGDIVLNQEQNIVLSAKSFPEIEKYAGGQVITTDGTTLLGADDKAGIAEIVTAAEFLIQHPEIKHGKVRIAFTPDEEIGRGADRFDVKAFGADFAFTVDGGPIGELEFENFNAARAKITIKGMNVHPGTAKNQMKNSMRIAMEFNNMLPACEVPEHTAGYEGFFHLTSVAGTVENTVLQYIIRDHNMDFFTRRKALVQEICSFLNLKYGSGTATCEIADQYFNMREKILPVIHIIDLARNAMAACDVATHIIPIRGGTDGSRLSYMGLPCPNIFAGGHNFHSRFEYIPVRSMQKAVEVIVKIIEMNAE